MATPYMSEIKIMSFGFAPQGWAKCEGQTLPINQNQALFALLGTNYGGNGQTNFRLPDLRGRTPLHMGNGHTIGEAAGSDSVTVTIQQLPQHVHTLYAASSSPASNVNSPVGNFLGNSAPAEMYSSVLGTATTPNPGTVTSVGGSQAHNNMQPFLVLNFCIALQGIFPSQN